MASAVDNGTSHRWKKIRERILRRDGYCCQQCGQDNGKLHVDHIIPCLLYTSPSPRDRQKSRMPSSA